MSKDKKTEPIPYNTVEYFVDHKDDNGSKLSIFTFVYKNTKLKPADQLVKFSKHFVKDGELKDIAYF